MPKSNPSSSVIKRLPRYYRFLCGLADLGVERISSGELAAKMGLTASQIRQDLNCFGGFGQQGYGYNVGMLRDEIAAILGLDSSFKAIIVGMGNLGRAISLQMPFRQDGFDLIGVFDKKESITGQVINGLPVRNVSDLDEFCRENKPDVAILCLPSAAVPEIADQLVKLGVKGFWNFSHYDLSIKYPSLAVENVHLRDSLMTFCYKVKQIGE
ncbi:MAG: redox-sensing transcriptional repressor Rex [Acutalibacteraceae bacterium]